MEIQKNKYIVITPVKNELPYFKETLESVCNQNIIPVKWIIVDDGSTDGTSELIIEYAKRYTFINHHRLVEFRTDLKSVGGRSGALMNYARKQIFEQVEFVIKIDADISFDENFFDFFFRKFDRNPKLGIASGHLVQDGIPEKINDYNSNRGATRIYRKKCFEMLESYYCSRGEDQMDTYKAQYLGWETNTFDIFFNHLKPETSKNGKFFSHYETGYFKGQIPYKLFFFIGTLIKNLAQKPYIIGSVYQLLGYVISRYVLKKRPFDMDVCSFIRAKQTAKLKGVLFTLFKSTY